MDLIGLALIPSETSHPAPIGHPERYERLTSTAQALGRPGMRRLVQLLPDRLYDDSVLTAVHDDHYIAKLKDFSQPGHDYLDPDTYRTSMSFAASCEVTWALLSAVDEALGAGPRVSFVIGRPPGHHAEAGGGMGFCLVNHIAVAAQYALDKHGCRRVAVVDCDVHHGNGTQYIFYDRSDVMYVSTHQYPFYPGTGARDETGRGEGTGYTLNFPLRAGIDDRTWLGLYEGEVLDRLREFAPDLILVSAGFDGHRLDPLGGFSLTGDAFGRLATLLKAAAVELCGGRLVSLFEGGYDPEGNAESITNYIRGLSQ